MPLKDTVQQTASAEIKGVTTLGKQVVSSKTWILPIRGIVHFATHRELWGPLTSRLIPLFTLSAGVIVPMFLFTYVPQAIALTFVNGPLAWVTTFALVLEESSAIINSLARGFLLEDALVDTFDAVLVEEGLTELVQNGRELKPGSNPVGKLGKMIKKPFNKLSMQALLSYLFWLPINFIPVVGTAAFIFVQGRKAAPRLHQRWFQLRGWGKTDSEDFVERNKPAYLGFGTVAVLLELVPGAGIFFLYTNTVAAALWAAELEKKGLVGKGGEGSAALPEESAKKLGGVPVDGHGEKKEL